MRLNVFRAALFAFGLTVTGTAAIAHEFTAAIFVTGDNRESRLAEAVNGFLLAADERDGHPAETSDGHLGGVDVQVLPLPAEAAGRVVGLTGSPQSSPDVLVVMGSETLTSATLSEFGFDGVLIHTGALPDNWATEDAPGSFAARYRSAYGTAPTEAAAQGYNAARRLDAAIRPLDGISPRRALETSLADTVDGINWMEDTR
ncbi:hypothetical protein SAMN05444851_1745 [Aliiroseovarius sediminilitoris]|uniref:Uncharacterized protein n=1 Tax=Aliiroseovarius sediminilitoris TaxID=1173584 RepID=A0A1I0PNS6_9RHOB|nr:hypothetical protein [Aliiroseovarius sediminilitoris]SEW15488.1 hypothetical protein SAMN05444851_1745 [Aliiroseovarius sediminilitoris]